ncbi:MAG: hypothetical protein LBJ58_05115 [Tannerellaceae bacterium]|jgi:hypothetical protein|nr:hypothetical protein [Tannerellaceae bacterium]
MKSHLLHVTYALAAIAGFSAVTMLLWNALLPRLFSVASIDFLQALGLLALSRILFGGFLGRGLGMHGGWNRRHNAIREKWLAMTPEERQSFVEKHHAHNRFFFGRFD